MGQATGVAPIPPVADVFYVAENLDFSEQRIAMSIAKILQNSSLILFLGLAGCGNPASSGVPADAAPLPKGTKPSHGGLEGPPKAPSRPTIEKKA